jgi:glycosyltransferase involved in cell wall biosynthesis
MDVFIKRHTGLVHSQSANNDCDNSRRDYKVGIIITTHGLRGQTVRDCLDSVLKHTPQPRSIMVFNNESVDPLTVAIPQDHPEVIYVLVEDQQKGGGLTGTWEKGARRLIDEEHSDVVVLLNHDTVVNETWSDLLDAAWEGERRFRADPDDRSLWSAFGPISDNPDSNKITPQALIYLLTSEKEICIHSVLINIVRDRVASGVNGFCLALPRSVLIQNRRLEDGCFFDLGRPFGGNENEWLWRLCAVVGQFECFVVRTCFVQHAKLSDWRSLLPPK